MILHPPEQGYQQTFWVAAHGATPAFTVSTRDGVYFASGQPLSGRRAALADYIRRLLEELPDGPSIAFVGEFRPNAADYYEVTETGRVVAHATSMREAARRKDNIAYRDARRRLYRAIDQMTERDDEEDAGADTVAMCEGGCGPAAGSDPDGVPLCAKCIRAGNDEALREIAELVGYDDEGSLVDKVRESIAGSSTINDELISLRDHEREWIEWAEQLVANHPERANMLQSHDLRAAISDKLSGLLPSPSVPAAEGALLLCTGCATEVRVTSVRCAACATCASLSATVQPLAGAVTEAEVEAGATALCDGFRAVHVDDDHQQPFDKCTEEGKNVWRGLANLTIRAAREVPSV